MSLRKELQSAYERGELEGLKTAILPFIRAHREKLLRFIREFQEIEGPSPLDQMIKVFILQQNLPFDMADFLAQQRDRIQSEVGRPEDPVQRQRTVSDWIRRKASDHRSRSMFRQVFCFEKYKAELMPRIEEELGLTPVS